MGEVLTEIFLVHRKMRPWEELQRVVAGVNGT